MLVGLGIACTCAVRYYFAPGQLAWGGDAAEHILYVKIASEAFAVGEWPIWTNYLAGGSPFLQFYGFLFFYLAAAIDQVCGDVFTSIKIVGGTAHALSGPAMYLLVRTATRSRRAGVVAGLAYVLCFWHAQQIAIMGRWPLSLFYLLLPLLYLRTGAPGPLSNLGGDSGGIEPGGAGVYASWLCFLGHIFSSPST